MRFDDDGQLDAVDRLAPLLQEQGLDATEIAATVSALQHLSDWQAPPPNPATQQALLATLLAQQSPAAQPVATEPVATEPQQRMPPALGWKWQIAQRQPRLIHRSVWTGATVAIFTVTCMGLLRWSFLGLTQPGSVLELFLPVIAAVSAAFLYGPETDMGQEVTQATPISPRFILACRLLTLGGYELLLGLAATGILAYANHLGFAGLALLWLGPAALLSACSLLLSLLIGPVVTFTSLCLAWLAQFVQFSDSAFGAVPIALTWVSQPIVFALAAVMLGVAFVAVSRIEPGTYHEEMRQ